MPYALPAEGLQFFLRVSVVFASSLQVYVALGLGLRE